MTEWLRSAGFVAREDLKTTLRQRETILWVFIMPVLFFYFIGTVTAGFGGPGSEAAGPDALALAGAGEGDALVAQLVRRLEERDFRVERPPDSALAGYRRRLTVPEPPAGFPTVLEAARSGRQVTLRFERPGDDLESRFDRVRVARAVFATLADLAVLAAEGTAPDTAAFRELATRPRSVALEVTTAGRRELAPSGFDQAIPGTLVMFTMLVLLTSGAILLVIEREQGLLRRLAATPISRGALVAGKWTGKMAVGIVQIAFALLAGTLLFGMDWGKALGALGVVLLAWAAFNASLGIVLANLARSEAQMTGIGVVVTMVLAALGGCWWPIEITPDWAQRLALVLPTGWAMDAMHRLVNFGYGGISVLPHGTALAVGALALGWVGARHFRYQ